MHSWKITGIVILAPLLLAWTAVSARADKITLKNGRVYEGKVIGKSDRRYLLSVDMGGERIPLSFFLDDVANVELSKNTVAEQIPYLKEVESFKVPIQESTRKIYEVSMYNKDQRFSVEDLFTEEELRKVLAPDEVTYYQEFNQITKRYAEKWVAIQEMETNLTQATKEDYASARQYMDDLYFELNALAVPPAFRGAHTSYLEFVKATFMVFNALDQNQLEEASRQIKVADDTRGHSIEAFRRVIESRRAPAPKVPSR